MEIFKSLKKEEAKLLKEVLASERRKGNTAVAVAKKFDVNFAKDIKFFRSPGEARRYILQQAVANAAYIYRSISLLEEEVWRRM